MATLMVTTVGDILETISDLRGESSTNTDAVRIRAVSRAEQEVASRKMFSEHLLQEQALTGTATNSYTIGTSVYPMRKRGLVTVYVGDTLESSKYTIVDQKDYREMFNANNAAKIAYEYYDTANDLWKVYINPAPETDAAIKYSYYYLPPTRTSTTNSVISPNSDIVARLALAYILEGEEEYDLADSYKNESEQMISELIGLEQERNGSGSRSFSTPYRGFGTY